MRDLVLDAIECSKILAKQFDIQILTQEPLAAPIIDGDPGRFHQVVMELFTYAIKFSPNRSQIKIFLEEKNGKDQVSIQDQGHGISKEFQTKIFDKFAQADSSSIRIFPGTGLGLAICKSIIEGHKGVIGFHGNEGPGTTFYFEIPPLRRNLVYEPRA